MNQPLVVSFGLGVDSMAMLAGLASRGVRPDAILFADTVSEKDETYRYLPVAQEFCRKVGFPEINVLKYEVRDFKNWPDYDGLEENCLTNGTLPSEAFGMGSCSQKWKQMPQNRWAETWAPAKAAWATGGKVRKAIGFDDSSADKKRSCKADRTFRVTPDARYDYWYPLQEWGWNRDRCLSEIEALGLPGFDRKAMERGEFLWVEKNGVPAKSSCFFCPNMKQFEVAALPVEKLARIVIMEARAKVRLEGHMTQPQLDKKYEEKLAQWQKKAKEAREKGLELPRAPKRKKEGEKTLMRGLWRSKMMTDFIREKGLLSGSVIDRLISGVPTEIIRRNEAHARGERVESWKAFMGRILVGLAG